MKAMFFSLMCLMACALPAQVVVIGNPPDGQQGQSYSYQFSASGGTAPYTYFVNPAPDFLSMNMNTGVLAGNLQSPVSGDTYNFTVTVSDSVGTMGTKACSITVGTGGGKDSGGGGGGCVATPADVWPTPVGSMIWGIGGIVWFIAMLVIFRRMHRNEDVRLP